MMHNCLQTIPLFVYLITNPDSTVQYSTVQYLCPDSQIIHRGLTAVQGATEEGGKERDGKRRKKGKKRRKKEKINLNRRSWRLGNRRF
jgi:hypothetical protein